jgi:hypothetical protein
VNYKSPERQVAEQLLNHMTIKWTHDGKTEYFKTYDYNHSFLDDKQPSGVKYEGVPAPSSTYDYSWASWVKDREGVYYDLECGNRRVGFWLRKPTDERGHWEYISYEQLFKSREFELIKSRGFWPMEPSER